MLLWGLMIAILLFLILSPMARLVISSFQEAETGRLTLANYQEAYSSARHLRALWHSLQLGLGVAFIACLFGVPIAWAISRTDMPAKGLVRLLVLGAFITPPYLAAIGWILLGGSDQLGVRGCVGRHKRGAAPGAESFTAAAPLLVSVLARQGRNA